MNASALKDRAGSPPHCSVADDVIQNLDAAPQTGLADTQVLERRSTYGENKLAEAPRIPAWKRYLAQFKDLLIIILLAAALISFVVSGELKTPIVVLSSSSPTRPSDSFKRTELRHHSKPFERCSQQMRRYDEAAKSSK